LIRTYSPTIPQIIVVRVETMTKLQIIFSKTRRMQASAHLCHGWYCLSLFLYSLPWCVTAFPGRVPTMNDYKANNCNKDQDNNAENTTNNPSYDTS
jgi:hypothetical protein